MADLPTPRLLLPLAGLGAALALVAAAPSCGSAPSTPGGAGGTGTTSPSTTSSTTPSTSAVWTTGFGGTTTSSTTISTTTPCQAWPNPPGIPAGWEEYTDWSCDCRLYVPASAAALPAPIAWEPCGGTPGAIDCRQMVVDWPYLGSGAIALNNFFDWKPGAPPVLAFRRIAQKAPYPYVMDVVAEVDGPAINGVIQQLVPGGDTADPGCWTRLDSMAEGKWVVAVHGHNAALAASKSPYKGVLGGSVGQLHPPMLGRWSDDKSHEWRVGADWIGHGTMPDDAFEVAPWPWSGQSVTPVSSPVQDPEHLPIGDFRFHQGALFWESSSQYEDGINVWTPVAGARPFIRWLNDYTHVAGSFGTDGVDMVWSEGRKQSASDPKFAGTIMTAPFTTDPQGVQPRRLRSFTEQIGAHTFAVGCGYAVNIWYNDAIVVRLSDGVSWMLPSTLGVPFTSPANTTYEDPIGITCDEVFIFGEYGGVRNIVRIRLDSLGPGTPPD
jgi:hypothetical protein